MPADVFVKPTVQLHLGDCLEVLKTLDAGAIDAVVSDPPYGMKWDTDVSRFSGGNHPETKGKGRGRQDVVGDDKPFDPSPWLSFRKVVLWGSNHYAAKLPVGTTLVFLKRSDKAFGSFLSDAEIGWMKGGYGVYCNRSLWSPSSQKARVHPTQKPIGLMAWCLEKLKLKPGMTVLDPYMGSGSTGVACVKAGVNFIGCEIDEVYFQAAKRRIKDAEFTLF